MLVVGVGGNALPECYPNCSLFGRADPAYQSTPPWRVHPTEIFLFFKHFVYPTQLTFSSRSSPYRFTLHCAACVVYLSSHHFTFYFHILIMFIPLICLISCFLRRFIRVFLFVAWPAGWKESLDHPSCCLSGPFTLPLPSNCTRSWHWLPMVCVCVRGSDSAVQKRRVPSSPH